MKEWCLLSQQERHLSAAPPPPLLLLLLRYDVLGGYMASDEQGRAGGALYLLGPAADRQTPDRHRRNELAE